MARILITGANRGLGLSMTRKLLMRGDFVAAGVRHISEDLKVLSEEFSEKLHIMNLDVLDESSVSEASKAVSVFWEALDIVVNNAAVYLEDPELPLEKTEVDPMMKSYQVNAVGPFLVNKYFYELIKNGVNKLIVNISSEAGSLSGCWRDREYGYCMSKAALNMHTRILQKYAQKDGIKVAAVHPGWMRTDMGGKDADLNPEESANGIIRILDNPPGQDGPIFMDYNQTPMSW